MRLAFALGIATNRIPKTTTITEVIEELPKMSWYNAIVPTEEPPFLEWYINH